MKNFPARQILKIAAGMAGFLSFGFFIAQFLSAVTILDVSLWSTALTNLLIAAFFGFVMIFIAICVLAIVIWFIAKWWRRTHPVAAVITPDENQDKPAAETATVARPTDEQFKLTTSLFFAGLSAFLYLLYLVGRTYNDSYLFSLGVPKGILNYSLDDYIYFGAHIDTLIIAVVFTTILIGFLLFWFKRHEIRYRNYNRWDFRLSFWFVLVYFLFYAVVLAFFAFVKLFRTDLDCVPAVIFTVLMGCAGTAIFLIGILFDKGILGRINKGEITRKIFVTSVVITLLVFPYMSADAWGAFKGILVKITTLPQVELCANSKIIDSIQWQPTGNNTFRSAEDLYLIVRTDDYMVLKDTAKPNDIFIVKFTDVLSTTVSGVECKKQLP